MDVHDLTHLLDLPAVRLLKAAHAAMIISFFLRTFKKQGRSTIVQGELCELLAVHIAELKDDDPTMYSQSPSQYLDNWCDKNHGFLRKYYINEESEPIFELTAGTEKALLWLESLRASAFIATESRFEEIFRGLEEILKYASGDADQRIERLEKEVSEILSEIEKIKSTGEVVTYTSVQLNERFERLLVTSRELLGDFRQVEENFKGIAQDIVKRHSDPSATKGSIVGHMLDSYEELREAPQGQSFYAFLELLLSPDRQNTFYGRVSAAYDIDSLEPRLRNNTLLKRLLMLLTREGEKVASSNQRLSYNLRRVLDTVLLSERRQIVETIKEIQVLAMRVREKPPDTALLQIESTPEIYTGFNRGLWSSQRPIKLSDVLEYAEKIEGSTDLRRLCSLPHIDLSVLRKNIAGLLSEKQSVTLLELLSVFPPKNGVFEVLGYLVIAAEDSLHNLILENEFHTLDLPSGSWSIPKVLFTNHHE